MSLRSENFMEHREPRYLLHLKVSDDKLLRFSQKSPLKKAILLKTSIFQTRFLSRNGLSSTFVQTNRKYSLWATNP